MNLKDAIDTPLINVIAMMNLQGVETVWCCCGYDYPDQVQKSHSYGVLQICMKKNNEAVAAGIALIGFIPLELLELLSHDCLQSCVKNEWKRDWSNGGVYLHLEVSEFIEALRGKGNPTNEAADVLFCFLALLKNHDIPITNVITKLQTLTKGLL